MCGAKCSIEDVFGLKVLETHVTVQVSVIIIIFRKKRPLNHRNCDK